MENIDTLWIYLEPYTFISEDSEYFFFYNVKKQNGISFCKAEYLNHIVEELKNIDNLYSVKIDVKCLRNKSVCDFVNKIQSMGYGDIIEGNLSKPNIMPPTLNLQRSVKRLKQHNLSISEDIFSYLHEVTIYINGECYLNCKDCKYGFKQYLCCTKSEGILDFEILKYFLLSIAYTGTVVTISGGNIFYYEELRNLLNLLRKINFEHVLIVNWRNVPEDIEILSLLSHPLCRLVIVVNTSFQNDLMVTLAKKLKQYNVLQLWKIAVTSLSDYEKAEILSQQLVDLQIEVNIKPLYDGINIAFFEQNVFLSEDDFETFTLDRQDIFALQELNTNDFGKIVILSDGKVYANVNKESIGNIGNSLGEMLCKELENGNSWRCTRYKTEPCNRCRFRLICPSPSNYELVIGKFNLCHIERIGNNK